MLELEDIGAIDNRACFIVDLFADAHDAGAEAFDLVASRGISLLVLRFREAEEHVGRAFLCEKLAENRLAYLYWQFEKGRSADWRRERKASQSRGCSCSFGSFFGGRLL